MSSYVATRQEREVCAVVKKFEGTVWMQSKIDVRWNSSIQDRKIRFSPVDFAFADLFDLAHHDDLLMLYVQYMFLSAVRSNIIE